MNEDDYYTHVPLNVIGSLKAVTPERLAQLLKAEADLAREIKEHDLATTFHAIAVKERDLERVRCDRLEADLAAARALLAEARESWIKVGYGASHEDVADCSDLCRRIDAAIAGERKP